MDNLLRDLEAAAMEPNVGAVHEEVSDSGKACGRCYEKVDESARSWAVVGSSARLTWLEVLDGIPDGLNLRTVEPKRAAPAAVQATAAAAEPDVLAQDQVGFQWRLSKIDGRWHEITGELGPLTGTKLERRRGPIVVKYDERVLG